MQQIYNMLISLNVYSLYFVKSYWLKEANLSPEGKYSSSLSIVLVTHASVILFVSKYYEWVNWRLCIVLLLFYHIAIAVIFSKRIEKVVNEFDTTELFKFYPLFLGYLLIGLVCLIILILFP